MEKISGFSDREKVLDKIKASIKFWTVQKFTLEWNLENALKHLI